MANIEKLRKNLEAHGFETNYFETKQEAADYLCTVLAGRTVGIGGSQTVKELGIYPRLCECSEVFWHDAQGPQAREKASAAPVYLTSANGVSETGELVNIDGSGNRVAATLYGKEKVYFIIGVNKIEPDLESAIHRARNIASPLNCRRLKRQTPCAVGELRCHDCNSPQRICRGLVVNWRNLFGVESTEVIIINESLGF